MKEIAEVLVGKQGNMSEYVMKHIRLFQVIQLIHFSKPCGGAALFPVKQFKKILAGNYIRNNMQAPAGKAKQDLIRFIKVWNFLFAETYFFNSFCICFGSNV